MNPWFIPLAAVVALAVVAGSVLEWWWLPPIVALIAGYILTRARKRPS